MSPNHFNGSKTALELIQRRLNYRASDAEANFGLHPLQGITTVFAKEATGGAVLLTSYVHHTHSTP